MSGATTNHISEAQKALTDLSGLDKSTVTICLAFGGKTNDVVFEQLPVSDEIAFEFRRITVKESAKWLALQTSGDLELTLLDAGAKPEDYQLEILPIDPSHPISTLLRPLEDLAGCDVASVKPDRLRELRFYTITAQLGGGEHVVFVRTYSSKMEIQNSTKLATILRDGVFEKIREPLLLFDRKFDCFVFRGYVFIIQRTNFQRIFDYVEATNVATSTALASVKSFIPMKNLPDFEAAVASSPRMAAKLRQALSRGLTQAIPVSRFEKVILECGLNVKVIVINHKKMLVFDPAFKWEFLRLLDDDYLLSELTDSHYEASGKRRVAASPSP